MFKENTDIQQSLFNKVEVLPGYLKDMLQKSWTQVFRDHVFPKINENRFSVLYSNKASRPNSPINVLIGLLVIKDIVGLSDDELVKSIHFNLEYQYALQSENLERQPISINSFTNFRNRLYNYELETGVDLLKEEVESLSLEFADCLEIDGKKVRMDSMMVSSSCKKMSRLELVYTVVYNHLKELAKVAPLLILEKYKVYLKESHKKEFIYQIKNDAIDSKLSILLKQAHELYQIGLKDEGIKKLDSFMLLERLIFDQVTIKEENVIEVKAGKEIAPNSLQSASDPDATYRKKYKDNIGYVANIVESYEHEISEDEKQVHTKGIITGYDFKANIHSDIEFGCKVIEEMIEERKISGDQDPVEVMVDGAYFEQELVNKAKEANIFMIFTNLVGRKPNPDLLSYTEFEIDEETKLIVQCPNGIVPIKSRLKNGVFLAHFNSSDCNACPLKDKCPMKNQKKSNVVSFSEKTHQTEQVRQEMSTYEYQKKANQRAGVEGLPSALRRGYDVDTMPIRGYVRSKMHFGFKLLALNVKRLHKELRYMENVNNQGNSLTIIHEKFSKLFQVCKYTKIWTKVAV